MSNPSSFTWKESGILSFDGIRQDMLEVESGFWELRNQLVTLYGRKLTNAALQQAGANGGATFASAFAFDVAIKTIQDDIEGEHGIGFEMIPHENQESVSELSAQAFRDCVIAYQVTGLGGFEIESIDWPIGRAVIKGKDTFESLMVRQREEKVDLPVCSYTAGVLIGFASILTNRDDILCIEKSCQACGAETCEFELIPGDKGENKLSVAYDPNPFQDPQLNLLDALLDRIPVGAAIFDKELHLRRFNQIWRKFIDQNGLFTKEQIVSGIDFTNLPTIIQANFTPVLDRVLSGETIHRDAYRQELDGVTSYWDIVITPLFENREVVGMLHMVINVTNRFPQEEDINFQTKQTQASLIRQTAEINRLNIELKKEMIGRQLLEGDLQQERDFISTILNTVSALVLVFDSQGRITHFNPACEEITGYTFEEVLGKHIWDLFSIPEDIEQAKLDFEKLLLGKFPKEYKNYLVSNNRSRRLISWTSTAVFDDDERVTHIINTGLDITDQVSTDRTLEQHVAERTRELSTLLNVSHKVASTLELKPLLEVILDQLKGVVSYTGATILTIEGEGMKVLAHRGPYPPEKPEKINFPINQRSNRDVILKGDTLFIPDILVDSPLVRAYREMGGEGNKTVFNFVRAAMVVPLVTKDQILGVLSLGHSKPNYYTLQQANLVRAFANQVAISIENARLYTETKRRADLAETLFNVQQAILHRHELPIILQTAANETRRLTTANATTIYLLVDDALETAAVSGEINFELVTDKLPLTGTAADRVFRTKKTIFVEKNVQASHQYSDLTHFNNSESFMVVPLLADQNLLGTIAISTDSSGKLGQDDEHILTMLASSIMLGLENERLNAHPED